MSVIELFAKISQLEPRILQLRTNGKYLTWLFAGRDSTGSAKELDRAKLVRERQNEERQRKLEELRQQALAAQRFREQREEERRRRIDELRSRDNDRFVDQSAGLEGEFTIAL